ncbi:uncharacterized protein LOC126266029 [Aethina tumida]|uniref:uncharacterized protein LOC126266029 n=1 Tax=Aethina tumida TaxID=116153 RepID=UPI00214975DB|nr:uncharacterized protein LOC126266029 [Aethina tumida]
MMEGIERAVGKKVRMEDVKIVRRYNCRNLIRENIIFSIEGEIFRKLMKEEKVEIDGERCFVKENFSTEICYRCCRFGHIAKHCKQEWEIVCYRCAGKHEGRVCKNEDWACTNCKFQGLEYEGHGALDWECESLRRRIRSSKRLIEYGNEH